MEASIYDQYDTPAYTPYDPNVYFPLNRRASYASPLLRSVRHAQSYDPIVVQNLFKSLETGKCLMCGAKAMDGDICDDCTVARRKLSRKTLG